MRCVLGGDSMAFHTGAGIVSSASRLAGEPAGLRGSHSRGVRAAPAGGAVFSPDGRWLYVGNFLDSDISVLRVDGDTVTNTGTLVQLPGRPASMRGRTQ
jgi:hypothetical protein